MTASEPITFHYHFELENGPTKAFDIRLDRQTLELLDRPTGPPPEWTRLDTCRCSNCPLAGKAEYCPVAVNLSHVVESFKDAVSYEHAVVTVRTGERTYQKSTTVQLGLSSIIGIYNVTSNCPVLDRLRPMVRFHLPFASTEETMYRAVAMYLTAQQFVWRRGGTPDWDLAGLNRVYEAIEHVEEGLSARFRHASRNDANVNAVILLAVFGQEIRLLLDNRLAAIEPWFPPNLFAGL
jgi:hypothetical protein